MKLQPQVQFALVSSSQHREQGINCRPFCQRWLSFAALLAQRTAASVGGSAFAQILSQVESSPQSVVAISRQKYRNDSEKSTAAAALGCARACRNWRQSRSAAMAGHRIQDRACRRSTAPSVYPGRTIMRVSSGAGKYTAKRRKNREKPGEAG